MYDAADESTVKQSGGNYSKHIYMGSQRIVSKLSNSGIFAASPVTATDQQARYALQTSKIKERFDSLGVVYKGTPQTGGLVSSNPASTASEYFYHSDHLGSSSLITDGTGALTQHIQYVPFDEVFVEERTNSWSTPYKFNGKELDEETGLYYYHARYYDPGLSVWLSVDPLAEKYPNVSSYVYCVNNPVKYVDPDGRNPAAALITFSVAEYLLISSGAITIGAILYLGPDGMIKIKDAVKAKLSAAILTSLAIELSKFEKFTSRSEVADIYVDNAKASTPQQRKEHERRESKSRQENVEIAKIHKAIVENGAPSPDPTGNVDPKKPVKTVVGAYVVLKVFQFIHNLKNTITISTNSDDSREGNQTNNKSSSSETNSSINSTMVNTNINLYEKKQE